MNYVDVFIRTGCCIQHIITPAHAISKLTKLYVFGKLNEPALCTVMHLAFTLSEMGKNRYSVRDNCVKKRLLWVLCNGVRVYNNKTCYNDSQNIRTIKTMVF
jgi:hypothetical protein